MIIEVFGTLCMLQFYSRKPVNLLLACSFSAHLPKFNPAIPKLQELGEDLQDSQRKIVKLRSDQNTSKIILLYGLRNSFLKCCLLPSFLNSRQNIYLPIIKLEYFYCLQSFKYLFPSYIHRLGTSNHTPDLLNDNCGEIKI